ncbi:hypothetical protein OEB99_02870 [Actinotalea sp. M2MS4P-6]|uniref:hypothetical protein n=1 Tax=Actinotalea sp. M2MS4P-6 TaxID=2983762 RepID=UPI0021E5041E|nr:hypothetical protein [Actinotalea sp. M2MS4P-6]MCV2393241.1 hypothetical protein [Actinotalea sp. M2MS4P-6]
MTESHARAKPSRRLPVWVWIVSGVLLVGVAATGALLMVNRGGGPVPPEAEVVTLPVPTPTVTAIDREPGTEFYDALPSEVLAFALADTGDAPELVGDGALEAYWMDYSDGSQEVSVLAGQWETAEEADAVYGRLADAASADAAVPSATAEPSTETEDTSAMADETTSAAPSAVEEGAVLVDGQEVGSYTIASHADGTALAVWSNGTVVLTASGPLAAVRDVYEAFPL